MGSYLSLLTHILAVGCVQCDFDRLVLSTNPFMEKNLEFLIECMDDLSMEQQKVCQLCPMVHLPHVLIKYYYTGCLNITTLVGKSSVFYYQEINGSYEMGQ